MQELDSTLKCQKKNCADIIICKSQFLPVHVLTSFRCMVQKDFSPTADVSPWRGEWEGGRKKQDRPCRYNVTWRSVRETTVAVEKQYVLETECVYSPSHPARKAHAPYYIVICGLPGSTVFFDIFS
jgi:hypothetical protein